jgi:hypothetical protein
VADPEFEPLNGVERAMLAARRGELPLEEFFARLWESDVHVPLRDYELDEGGSSFQLPATKGRDGRLYVPLFTARERATAFGAPRYTSLLMRELAQQWPDGVNAIVNPGEAVEMVLGAADVRNLPTAADRDTIPAGTHVMIGEPAEEPEAALRAVTEVIAGRPAVRAAYRAQVFVDRPGEEPQLAIGLDLGGAAPDDELLDAVGAAAVGAGAGNVGIVLVEPGSGDAIAQHMLAGGAPFYRRT